MTMKLINLLPKEKQRQLLLRDWYWTLLRLSLFAVLSLILCVGALGGAVWYLEIQEKKLARQAEELKSQANAKAADSLRQQVKAANARLTDYSDLAAAVPRWSKFLKSFVNHVPAEVRLQSLSVDIGKKQVNINGFAPTRDKMLALYDNLVADRDHFTDVDYPLENVIRPKDVSFHFSFIVKDDLLQ